MLGTKQQRAEKPCSRTETHGQPCQGWGKGCSSTRELLTQLNTPVHTPRAAPRSVTRPATKIHSDLRATSDCKWPREVVGMGQDLDFSCSNCAHPGCSRGSTEPSLGTDSTKTHPVQKHLAQYKPTLREENSLSAPAAKQVDFGI